MILGIIILIILLIIVYFNIPYSRLRKEFKNYLAESKVNTNGSDKNNKYTLEDLPMVIQKFYKSTGLDKKINTYHVSFDFKDANFVNIEMKKTLKIDYSEHIFASVPARFAFIDSSLYGIPFQGLDSLINGRGGMKGVVAKNFTIFNQSGIEMDKATLVTCLCQMNF